MKFIIVCTLISLFGCAYGQGRVSGTAFYDDNSIAEFCTFELLNASDSSFAMGYVGDTLGTFYFQNIPPGEYYIRTSQYGYIDNYTDVISVQSDSQIELSPIVLKAIVNELQGAVVTAYKPLMKFRDGALIVDVQNDLMSSGSSVLDMLKRVPGVSVDETGNILINGKSGVGIMFDGRLQQMPTEQLVSILENTSADAIATIELIKNPPASYDSKGISGLINITAKKASVNGFNGSIDESASMGRKFRNAISGSFNGKSSRISLFLNASYRYKDQWSQADFDRTIGSSSPLLINTKTAGSAISSGLNFNSGIEVDLSPKAVIGVNVNGNFVGVDMNNTARTDISDSTGLGYDYFLDNTGGNEDQKFVTANLYYSHILDSLGSCFKYSGDYTYYNYLYPKLNTNSFFTTNGAQSLSSLGYLTTSDLDFKIFTNSLDYTKTFSEKWELNTGLKMSSVRSDNLLQLERNQNDGAFAVDSSLTNLYDYDEDVYAGYASAKRSFKKMMITIGLRAEQTVVNGNNRSNSTKLDRSYLNFFPNLSLDYQPNDKNMMLLSYSYRIDRPGFQQLIPGRIFVNQLNYIAGAPTLNPQYSHNVNFEHFYNNSIGNSVGFTRIDNSVYEYSYTQSNQVSVDTTINFASKNMINYTFFCQKQFAKWYRTQFTVLAMYSTLKGDVGSMAVSTQTFAVAYQMNNDFLLPKDFKIQLSGRFTGPFTEGVVTQSARGAIDIAVRKKFFNNKLSTVLGISDILFTDYGATTINLNGQSMVNLPKRDTRRVNVSIVYRFGNVKIDRKNKPSEGNDRLKPEEN